jgi:hypothetical protein
MRPVVAIAESSTIEHRGRLARREALVSRRLQSRARHIWAKGDGMRGLVTTGRADKR